MEVDSSCEEPLVPSSSGQPQAKLTRSSSAPLLNTVETVWTHGNSSRPSSPLPHFLPSTHAFRDSTVLRNRTVSASGPHSPVVPRVQQIRAEEMEGIAMKEAMQERELTSKFAISQSCDELFLEDQLPSPSSPAASRRLHSPIFTCPSPSHQAGSPKHCFSPSLRQATMRASPSPTRVQRHRSQSPQLILRPSALGALKRKLSTDSDQEVDRAKRLLTLEDKDVMLQIPAPDRS